MCPTDQLVSDGAISSPATDRPADCRLRRIVSHPLTAWFVIGIGIVLRLRRYLQERGLLHDDALLATNVFGKSFTQLLGPLNIGNQAAPVGFVILQKCATEIFGHGELTIRLVPLVASVIALPIFFLTLRKIAGPAIAVAATAWLALAEPLVQYSAEGKQYSTDVLWVTVMLALAAAQQRKGKVAILALAGAVLLWFSHPLLFVLGGIGLARIINHCRQREFRLARADVAMGVCWFISFAANYLLVSRHYVANDYLRTYWQEQGAFAPIRLSLPALLWYPRTIFGLINYPLGIVSRFTDRGRVFVLACDVIFYIAAASFAFGWVVMARRSKQMLSYLIATLALALAGSALQRYPFSGRLTLFCAPLVVLPLAFAVGIDWPRLGSLASPVRVFVCAILFVFPIYLQAKYFLHPETPYDLKPALNYVKGNWRDGDSLYLHWGSDVLGDYYLNMPPVLNVPGAELVHGIYEPDPTLQVKRYADDLLQMQGRNRVWIVFSMGADQDEQRFEQILAHRGQLLDHRQFRGGAADLYDLQRSPKLR